MFVASGDDEPRQRPCQTGRTRCSWWLPVYRYTRSLSIYSFLNRRRCASWMMATTKQSHDGSKAFQWRFKRPLESELGLAGCCDADVSPVHASLRATVRTCSVRSIFRPSVFSIFRNFCHFLKKKSEKIKKENFGERKFFKKKI